MAVAVKFEEIEKDLKSTVKVAEKLDKDRSKIETGLARVLQGAPLAEIKVDLVDKDFEAVKSTQVALETNLATMVHGLDQITNAFGAEFKTMAQQTTGEKIMSVFSKRKSEEMRSARVRTTSIRGNLTTLIQKSNVIQTILTGQETVLIGKLKTNIEGQKKVLERGEETAREIAKLNSQLDAIAPKIAGLDAKIAEASGEARKKLQTERATSANEYNDVKSKLETATANAQSLEKYASQYANYIDSLVRQRAAQEALISKIKLDTEQRTVLYDTLAESLRTAQQQDVAHRIVEVGAETDAQSEDMMLQIGASSSNKLVSMFEAHKEYMRRTNEIRDKGKIVDDEFNRRFAAVAEKLDKGRYTETAAAA
jgi:chromosome segregation ATPase